MDVSRTCFRATKNVPGLGPRAGVYYFLDEGAPFLAHSMLGGHWFEGRPFQTGDWSTAPTPAPTWRDGSIPTGGTFPVISCCRGAFADFTLGLAEYRYVRASDSAVSQGDYETLIDFACAKAGFQAIGGILSNEATLGGAGPLLASIGGTGIPPQAMRLVFEHDLADPLYVMTTVGGPGLSVIWPTSGVPTVLSSVRVRWFRAGP